MLIRPLLLASFLFIYGNANASFYIPRVDSSEESSIEFVKLRASSSLKIVHFTWEVSEEIAGSHFIIEKSTDQGESWSSVSRVESLVDHCESHTYKISEINLVEGIKEKFRISRVDKYGKVDVLDIIDVNNPILSNMKLIPNPRRVKKYMTVSCESMINSEATLYVYSELGELVYVNDMPLINGYNRIILTIKNFDPGNYVVVVKNNFEDKLSSRLVIY